MQTPNRNNRHKENLSKLAKLGRQKGLLLNHSWLDMKLQKERSKTVLSLTSESRAQWNLGVIVQPVTVM